jgi:hypothetical protein
MKKQIAAGLLILTLTASVGSASAGYSPGLKTGARPIITSAGYSPGHKLTTHNTSFVQQVRSVWERLFAWM